MDKAQMNLALAPTQIEILRRVLDGEKLRKREISYLGVAPAYFGDPPNPMEIVAAADVDVLLAGEGPDRELLKFCAQPFSQTLVAELTDLGTIYALRSVSSVKGPLGRA